jgi:uncharacterized membrane protein
VTHEDDPVATGFQVCVPLLAVDLVPTDFWTSVGQGVISPLAMIVSAAGIVVIIWGAYNSLVRLIAAETAAIRGPAAKPGTPPAPPPRMLFISYLLPGLEFMIAGSVIKTLVVPDWQQVVTVAGIVLVRTLLGLSLRWEKQIGIGVKDGVAPEERLAARPAAREGTNGSPDEAVLMGNHAGH